MWHQRFGLRCRPFAPGAAGELFPPGLRASQLATLEETLTARAGFALLSGAAGLGKTFLLRRLAERLGDGFHLAWLAHPKPPSVAALHQALLFDFDQAFVGKPEQELRLAAIEQILKQAQAGRATLLVVDDAHHLQIDQLEELRLLGNLEAEDGKHLVGLLAGQPSLTERLGVGELVSLAQQIGARVNLEPLTPEEAIEFVARQLQAAGGTPEKLIEEEAVELLAQIGQGVPRLLNNLGRTAFRLAAAADSSCVDAEAVLAAADELGLQAEEDVEAPPALTLPRPQKRSA